MGGVLSLDSLREASCLGLFSPFGQRLKGGLPDASGGWERVWEGLGERGSCSKEVCARVSQFLPGRLGVLQALGAVPSAERDSEGVAHSELSWVLNRAALGPDDGKAVGQCLKAH